MQSSYSSSPDYAGDNVFTLRSRIRELLAQFEKHRFRSEEEFAQANNNWSAIKEHSVMLEEQHTRTVSVLNEKERELVVLQRDLPESNFQIAQNYMVLQAREDSYKRNIDEYNLEINLERSDGERWKRAHALCEQTLSTMQSRLQNQWKALASGLDGEEATIKKNGKMK